MNRLTCLFIRHGKTQGNIEKRYIGQKTDEPLCEEGIRDLRAESKALICGALSTERLRRAYVSPMRRCIQTAQIILPDYEYIYVDDFREIDFGSFENKNYIELADNSDYQEWIASGGSIPFPNGEARADFVDRNIRAFREIMQSESVNSGDRTVPFVLHGGSIMAIMSELTGEDYYSFQLQCGEILKIELKLNGAKIDVISYDRVCYRSDT